MEHTSFPTEQEQTFQYSFYQVEGYRHYFDVTTALVTARIKNALFPYTKDSGLLRPSSTAGFQSMARGTADLYGWFWISLTIIFFIFFSSVVESNYLDYGKYEMSDLWTAFLLVFGGNTLWPIIATYLQPPPQNNLESGQSSYIGGWRFWMSMYGYVLASVPIYFIPHFVTVLIFGAWQSSWPASMLQWILTFGLVLLQTLYLVKEGAHLYPSTGGTIIPFSFHFLYLLILQGMYTILLVYLFYRF
jgi:hypothetical protein